MTAPQSSWNSNSYLLPDIPRAWLSSSGHVRVQEGYWSSSHQSIFHQSIVQVHSRTKQVQDKWFLFQEIPQLVMGRWWAITAITVPARLINTIVHIGTLLSLLLQRRDRRAISTSLSEAIQEDTVFYFMIFCFCFSSLIQYDYPSEFR